MTAIGRSFLLYRNSNGISYTAKAYENNEKKYQIDHWAG